jgi:nucleolar protein 58
MANLEKVSRSSFQTKLSQREKEKSSSWSLTTSSVSLTRSKATSSHAETVSAGHSISKKLGINVVSDSIEGIYRDMFRGIREQLTGLLDGLDPKDLATMSLGLSHSLSRQVRIFITTCTFIDILLQI